MAGPVSDAHPLTESEDLSWFSPEQVGRTVCPIQDMSRYIDSCAKAKVVAVMALQLFVFDGQLHGHRSNWACPFGDCKENFKDREDLMRHVIRCCHSAGDKVYCNSCRGYDCFGLQNQRSDFYCEDENVECWEKSLGKKSKTKRTLSNLSNIFSRSRSGSRPSSPAVSHLSSQNSVSGRQSSMSISISGVASSPATPTEARKHSWVSVSATPKRAVKSYSYPPAQQEMDATPRPCELPVVNKTHELSASDQPFTSATSGFEATSALPVFAENREQFTSSPAPMEDLDMAETMPSHIFRESASNSSQSGPPSYPSHLFSATVFSSMAQPSSTGRDESSWSFPTQQTHSSQSDMQLLQAGDRNEQIFPAANLCASNFASPVANVNMNGNSFPRGSYQLAENHSTNQQSYSTISNPSRHNSGDSWSSNCSDLTQASAYSDPLQSYPLSHHQSFDMGMNSTSVSPPGSFSEASPMASSPSSDLGDLSCHMCNYRPKGKEAHWKMYLQRHITHKHQSSKIPCPDCGKEISRKDNLKYHQKTACQKNGLSRTLHHSSRRTGDQETGHRGIGRRTLRTHIRSRDEPNWDFTDANNGNLDDGSWRR